jgi:hypothetical protein
MAFGDVGGSYTELCITFRVIGNDKIRGGDAVCLVDNWTVSRREGGVLFGQAFENERVGDNEERFVTIRVRGVSYYRHNILQDSNTEAPIKVGRQYVFLTDIHGAIYKQHTTMFNKQTVLAIFPTAADGTREIAILH